MVLLGQLEVLSFYPPDIDGLLVFARDWDLQDGEAFQNFALHHSRHLIES